MLDNTSCFIFTAAHICESQPNTPNMRIVSDNLRKGAATNAVQIAEYLLEKGLV